VGSAPEAALGGSVVVSEPLGAESYVTLAVGETRITAQAPAFFDSRPGQPAWVLPSLSKAHRFDRATGLRV
jgi:multiple sugar transport system ATP-binding protein